MIVAVVGTKGGVGKSTVALAIGAEWFRRGRSVLLVDADPQASLLTWREIASERQREAPPVVAMGASLADLSSVAAGHEVTVIDTPPRAGSATRNALLVADLALLPCGPAPMDAWALSGALEVLEEARRMRPELEAAVVLTRVSRRTTLGATAREALGDCGVPVLETELGNRIAYQEAPATGRGVTTYDPNGAAADEVRALVDEIEALVGFGGKPNGKGRARPKAAARQRR